MLFTLKFIDMAWQHERYIKTTLTVMNQTETSTNLHEKAREQMPWRHVKPKPSRRKSANSNAIPHDAYHQIQVEYEGDDPHTEAKLNAMLQEEEAKGIDLIPLLHKVRESRDEREEEYLENKLNKHAEEVIRIRQIIQDSRARGDYSQGHHSLASHSRSRSQDSHPPQQVANKAVRRVASALPVPPHPDNSRTIVQEKRVHFRDPMGAQGRHRTQGEQPRYGQATQTHPVSQTLNTTFVDTQPNRAHYKDLMDVERKYRTQGPTDVGQHTDIHERTRTSYRLLEPHDAQSEAEVYGFAWQCCNCSAIRVKSSLVQRCYQCPHLKCYSCTEHLGDRMLRVEVDAQGKLQRLSSFNSKARV
jgi:hypothetical protein